MTAFAAVDLFEASSPAELKDTFKALHNIFILLEINSPFRITILGSVLFPLCNDEADRMQVSVFPLLDNGHYCFLNYMDRKHNMFLW